MPKSGQQFYYTSMLHNATGLTSLTPRTSVLREGGLLYSQIYSSVKKVINATKTYPFQNDALEVMALDSHVWQGT